MKFSDITKNNLSGIIEPTLLKTNNHLAQGIGNPAIKTLYLPVFK